MSRKAKFNKHTTALQVLQGLNTDLSGKTVFITGANSGIGYETARALALHNAHVVMACRNMDTAEKALRQIRSEKANAQLDLIKLDLNDLKSVEYCAQEYLSKNWPIHILILNAGVYNPEHRVTDNGFEATFQINHLAQFHLTNLLLDRIIASAPARIVVVASVAHKYGVNITPENISWDILSPTEKNKLNSAYSAYGLSKFCNVMYATELQKRVKDKNITVVSLMPGVIHTNITRNSSGLDCLITTLMKPASITQEQGAATTVYCAVAPEVEEHGGEYYDVCKPTLASAKARNPQTIQKLWVISEEMIAHYKNATTKQSAKV